MSGPKEWVSYGNVLHKEQNIKGNGDCAVWSFFIFSAVSRLPLVS